MKFRDLINEAKKPIFKVQHKDSIGDTKTLGILDKGEVGYLANQANINTSISDLAYNITPADFKRGGYENSGVEDSELFVRKSAVKAWKLSRGNPEKFAEKFSDFMKIKFTLVK